MGEHRGPPVRAGRPEKDFRDGMGVPIGVPTEDHYRSAPTSGSRPMQGAQAGGPSNIDAMRRHTGDGNYRGDVGRGPMANAGGGARSDAKGVRNEEAPSFGGSAFA